jgi:hypothetical protein
VTRETVIRPSGPGDEARLADLFSRVYGKPFSEERWRWKLGRRGSPVPNAWLAERDGAPVCHYGGIPAGAQIEGREATVMVAVDALTSPEHRRQGLLTEVVRRAHDAWREGGIAFVLGLPNEQWGSRARVLGWTPLFRLRWLAFPFRPGAILRRRYGAGVAAGLGPLAAAWLRRRSPAPRPDRGVEARAVERAGPAFDALWERLRSTSRLSIRRDGPWVGWRFLEAPEPGYRVVVAERDGRPLGWSAFRMDRSRGHAVGLIADVAGDPSEAGSRDAVIEATLSALAAEGAESASTLAVEGTERYRRLRGRGFLPRPHGFVVHAVVLDPRLDLAALRRPAAWDMAGGDFDVI